MKFKYLNLKKARVLTTNNRESTQQYPGRRTFVKAMGLGALAWNPLVNSLKSITTDSLKFKLKNNQLKVYLNNILAWEISEKYFEPGFTIQLKQTKNNYSLTAKRLKLRQTDFGFSLKADIYNKNGPWEFDFNIPEFRFKQTGNFYHWLENTQPLTGKAHLQHEIAKLNPTEFICARGTFNLELEPNWKFNFSSSKNVQLSFNRHQYSTGRFVIQPQLNKTEKFLKSNLNGITLVSLPEFNDWKNFINNIDSFSCCII